MILQIRKSLNKEISIRAKELVQQNCQSKHIEIYESIRTSAIRGLKRKERQREVAQLRKQDRSQAFVQKFQRF